MEVLEIHVFKDSFKPIVELLSEKDVSWSMRETRTIQASSGVIEIVLNAGAWISIAAVVNTFIKARHGRRVIITTKDKQVLDAQGLTKKELESVLKDASWITPIDPKNHQK